METLKVSELQAKLQQEGAQWQAAYTNLSELAGEELKSRLGAVPPGPLPTAAQKKSSQKVALAAHEAMISAGIPSSKDWRNHNGQNYVTSVKNQGGCGSCVAFGATASVESKVRIKKGAGYAIDISEAHLFYCLKGDPNGCQNGWWPNAAYDNFKNSGVALENYFPYVGNQQACNVNSGWQNQKVQIKDWKNITDIGQIKNWLANKGPMSACFEVFSDFYSYSSGVYTHVSGGSVGWHCVCVIGYDDNQRCWICKNSWGTNWGDNGYFKIRYGQCSFELYGMWGVEEVLDSGWLYNKKVIGLWTINQNQNAWAYIEGEGWKRVFPNNQNNFFNILTQLIGAKNKGSTVSVRIKNGQIVEIYS